MNETDTPCRLFPPWLEVGTVTALLVPLFYTAGWSYAYHYFEHFNLGLIGLDISKEHFFLYSYWTVKDQFWLFLMVLGGYLLMYYLGRIGFQRLMVWGRGRKVESVLRGVPAFLAPIMFFSLF